MSSSKLVHQSARALRTSSRVPAAAVAPLLRLLSTTASTHDDKKYQSPGDEGQFARTDDTVRVKYPEEKDMPRSAPVQGRGGMHYRRTLPTFSLQGNVGIITGGARGLGLVMAQGMVVSGASVALVDLNSKSFCWVQLKS